jgi:hypothetical protein
VPQDLAAPVRVTGEDGVLGVVAERAQGLEAAHPLAACLAVARPDLAAVEPPPSSPASNEAKSKFWASSRIPFVSMAVEERVLCSCRCSGLGVS